MKEKLTGFVDTAKILDPNWTPPSIEETFGKTFPIVPEKRADSLASVLSTREGCGGCFVNGAFIEAGERIAIADFLVGRGHLAQKFGCCEAAGGCTIKGAFIAASDRLAAADFLMGRGGLR